MLFDLKGRRRRVVQVTYVGLALLMGGGLVLSGIGSDASGGLLDAFVGQGGDDGDARKPFEEQIKRAEQQLRANPENPVALQTLVRAHFGLAGLERKDQEDGSVAISDKGIEEMKKAEAAWGRYVATNPERIDTGLAATVIQIYSVVPLPQDQKAKNERYVRPAREIAEQQNTVEAYIRLVAVATRAGDTRTADLAERKALTFAESKDQRATIEEQIETEKASASAADSSASGNGAAPQPSGP